MPCGTAIARPTPMLILIRTARLPAHNDSAVRGSRRPVIGGNRCWMALIDSTDNSYWPFVLWCGRPGGGTGQPVRAHYNGVQGLRCLHRSTRTIGRRFPYTGRRAMKLSPIATADARFILQTPPRHIEFTLQ